MRDCNFPRSLVVSLFSWRCLAASSSSSLHTAVNLHPPSVTASTQTSAFNAIDFQSPVMPNARMSLCTQSVIHSFFFPPRPLRTAPSRFQHACLVFVVDHTRCCCCCCFSHSAHWLPTRKKLLYTVANSARGLLNREKNKNKKFGSARPPPPPPPARCSFGEKKIKKKKSRDASTFTGATQVGVTQVVSVRLASVQGFLRFVS